MNRKGFSLFITLLMMLNPLIVGSGSVPARGAKACAAAASVSNVQKSATNAVNGDSKKCCKREGYKSNPEPTPLQKLLCMIFVVGFLFWYFAPRKGANSSSNSGCKDNPKRTRKNASERQQESGELAVVPQ